MDPDPFTDREKVLVCFLSLVYFQLFTPVFLSSPCSGSMIGRDKPLYLT